MHANVTVSLATARSLAQAAEKFKGTEGAAEFIEASHGLAYVAERDGEIVGWCWGYDLVRPDDRSMVYVHLLEVDDSARRLGIGRNLMEAMLSAARERGASKVFLVTQELNSAARHLYESLGGGSSDDGSSVMYWWRFEN